MGVWVGVRGRGVSVSVLLQECQAAKSLLCRSGGRRVMTLQVDSNLAATGWSYWARGSRRCITGTGTSPRKRTGTFEEDSLLAAPVSAQPGSVSLGLSCCEYLLGHLMRNGGLPGCLRTRTGTCSCSTAEAHRVEHTIRTCITWRWWSWWRCWWCWCCSCRRRVQTLQAASKSTAIR